MERNQIPYSSKNCSIQCTANTFNSFVTSIGETSKKTTKYSHKHFLDYLANKNSSTIFLQPTFWPKCYNL